MQLKLNTLIDGDLSVNRPIVISDVGVSSSSSSTSSLTENTNKNIKPELFDEVECSERVYKVCGKKTENAETLPSIAELAKKKKYSAVFGKLNEIEYSANIVFEDPIIATTSDIKNGIRIKHRVYYKDERPLYYNDVKISTRYFDGCEEIAGIPIFLRVDTNTHGDDDDDNDGKMVCASSKLKVLRKKFVWEKCKYVLTGSIEVDVRDVETLIANKPSAHHRERFVTFWALHLRHRGRSYRFEVAFRKESADSSRYECNIECEDEISAANFIECFDLLYKYYKYQYIHCNRNITPIINEILDYTKFVDLTPIQIKTLTTLQHVSWEESQSIIKSNIDTKMKQFIELLGIAVFLRYGTVRSLEYDGDFRHVDIAEYYNDHCDDDDDDDIAAAEDDISTEKYVEGMFL